MCKTMYDSRIPSKGRIVILTLHYAFLHVEKLSFPDETGQLEQRECLKELQAIMVRISAVCCGEDYWFETRKFLLDLGVEIPEEMDYVMTVYDRKLDEIPGEGITS